jgi:hypothetical protein
MPIVVMRQLANHNWPKQEAKKYTCDINLQSFLIKKKGIITQLTNVL